MRAAMAQVEWVILGLFDPQLFVATLLSFLRQDTAFQIVPSKISYFTAFKPYIA